MQEDYDFTCAHLKARLFFTILCGLSRRGHVFTWHGPCRGSLRRLMAVFFGATA